MFPGIPGESSLGLGSPDSAFIEVLVDLPTQQLRTQTEEGQQLFIYQVPDALVVCPGDILSVPFGNQQLGAIAIRQINQLPPELERDRVKTVEAVIQPRFFPPTYPQLLQQVASYYQAPLIQVIRTALPAGLLRGSQRRVRLLTSLVPSGAEVFLPVHSRTLLTLLQTSKTGDLSWKALKQKIGSTSWARRAEQDLLKRGWIEVYLESPKRLRAMFQTVVTLVVNPDGAEALTLRQREILYHLKNCSGEMERSAFLKLCQTTSRTLQGLADQGCITLQKREVLRLAQGERQPTDTPKSLTSYQATAVEAINGLSGFTQVLLHGVTGSGKTEVYLQVIPPILQRYQSVLVLVPEIGLTPQLTDRFRARFGDQVYVYHSGLSEGERYDTWRTMTLEQPRIVIGTRSAIFAPLANLGLIILDEEHDSSFKQDQPAPCYHARTVAQWRAELENCPLILGSATPALESWVDVKVGNFELQSSESSAPRSTPQLYLSLPERVQGRPLPQVEVVDMRQELRQGNRSIFSQTLQQALGQMKDQGQQGILFIHRRGHSTFVSCRSCGYVMECSRCDVSLAYHHVRAEATQQLRCHYCNKSQPYPQHCPECGSSYFKHFGSGTQRVSQELNTLFPHLRLIRFDSDTTQTKDAHRILLTRFAQGGADLLVGTQMLTKGLDLASVGLVGIISADGLLHLADYRASERAFQTLLQVAGRAGRGDDPGRVILQTYSPDHPVIQAVQTHGQDSFVKTELNYRRSRDYPPYSRLILLRFSGPKLAEVEQTAQRFAQGLTQQLTALPSETIAILGPAPAPIPRISHQYRWQLLLKLLTTVALDSLQLENLRPLCPRTVRLIIDVDPLNFS
ncbi:MAG: primosomal protein N' [Microcoleaceae cyanobacterium]